MAALEYFLGHEILDTVVQYEPLVKGVLCIDRAYNKHDEEYKKNIVKLAESGKPVADISCEYGLGRSAIYS